MNRIQEALMHLHKIVMFVPDEVQDELGEVEQLLKEELLERANKFEVALERLKPFLLKESEDDK